MSPTKTIPQYADAGGIDPAQDYFLLYQNSTNTYRRINRNTVLGTTGTPVDTTSAQTLTNKTLGNTNIVTLRDDRFTLQDNLDATKQAQFQLSGITTATTRTYTLPNASSTLADISTAQTLTNKTITSPTINGGSISNATITTDTITGFTVPTTGTVFGLPISGGVIGTTGLDTNAVTTVKIADTAVTPSKLFAGAGTSWLPITYTSTLSSVTGTFTNASITANYTQVGKRVFLDVIISIVTNGTAATAIRFTLPKTAASTNFGAFYGREDIVTGQMIVGTLASTTTVQVLTYNNVYPGGDGRTIKVTGSYNIV